MGEGCTPLVEHPWRGGRAHFKLEWFAPTGSFKDRGSSVMLSLLHQQGIQAVLEDSSGNGGASVSAYAAAGGMRATIMAPESTSPAKTVQMRAHGATVELIPGNRQATSDAAIAASDRSIIASTMSVAANGMRASAHRRPTVCRACPRRSNVVLRGTTSRRPAQCTLECRCLAAQIEEAPDTCLEVRFDELRSKV